MRRRWSAALVVAGLVVLVAACGGAPGAVPMQASTADPRASAPLTSAPAAPSPAASSSAPTAQAADGALDVMPRSEPVRLDVASIGVDSELMPLGLLDDGTLEVPPGAFPAGWFTGAPTPGELGPAVIAGHIDWVTGPGVFHRLAALEVGDEIRVERSDGTTAVFRTTEVARYAKDAFPTELVYGDLDHAGLRLISCGGAFNRSTGHYEDNVVAFAELVGDEAD